MQISYVGQYNKNANQTVGTPVPSSAVTSLTASVRELLPGSVFEGNVTYIRGNNVILSLENGQNIHARLDKNAMKLMVGQSMFFQVRSNEGGTVAIRPYMGGTTANPTLMRALEAAGLPADERNLQMVDAMMREQMPIHADAVMEMHRAIIGNEGVRVDTLVQMTKLQLPITPQLAAQFENYRNDTHMLLDQMNELMSDLPKLLAGASADAPDSVPKMVRLNAQILQTLTQGLPEEPLMLPHEGAEPQAAQGQEPQQAVADIPLPPLDTETATASGIMQQAETAVAEEGVFYSQLASEQTETGARYTDNQLGAFLQETELDDFSDMLRSLGNLADNEVVFDEDGALNRNLTARQLLDVIDHELQAQLGRGSLEDEEVRELFSHRGYQKLLTRTMEEQWLVKPQELKTKDKLSELYDRLNRQMEQIDRILKATGNEHSPLARTSEQIRGNMEFMSQVNQIYNYVQLPLKMHGQNANGDLYVYTNKRRTKEENGELSAFLHLDMEHLGSTDVMVTMKGKSVDTNFTFADDASYDLVEKYLPILDAKLSALGYHSRITIGHREQKTDFAEALVKKERTGGGSAGVVHRYSFDVRA